MERPWDRDLATQQYLLKILFFEIQYKAKAIVFFPTTKRRLYYVIRGPVIFLLEASTIIRADAFFYRKDEGFPSGACDLPTFLEVQLTFYDTSVFESPAARFPDDFSPKTS